VLADADCSIREQSRRKRQRRGRRVLGDVGEFLGSDGLLDVVCVRRVLVNRAQPAHRVIDLGAERHAHHAETGGAAGTLVRIADRQRRDRHHARARQLVVGHQVAAQRPAADGEHGIVDRGTRDEAAHLLELVDREAAGLEHAMRRHLGVEARDRQALRVQPELAQRADERGRELPHRSGQRGGEHQRLHDVVQRGPREQ
jgi:hypothetical protein